MVGIPELLFTKHGAVLQVSMRITANQRADTVDGLMERRKFLHLGMLDNMASELDRELKPIESLLQTILFCKLDKNRDGIVDKEEIRMAFPQLDEKGADLLIREVGAENKGSISFEELLSSLQSLDETLVRSLAGSDAEHDLRSFLDAARKTCASVLQAHTTTQIDEFNDDVEFNTLVNEAIRVKTVALEGNRKSKLLGAWFSSCAKASVSELEEIVARTGAKMWSDAKVVDSEESTPLLVACEAGSLKMCRELIEAEADVSAANRKGKTPLLFACDQRNLEMCDLLIQAGAGVGPLLSAAALQRSAEARDAVADATLWLLEKRDIEITGEVRNKLLATDCTLQLDPTDPTGLARWYTFDEVEGQDETSCQAIIMILHSVQC